MRSLRDLEATIFNKINPAVSFSVTRYVLAIGIFVAVFVFGIISTLSLGVDLLPAVNIPVVVVVTSFPGATPGVVDQQVTQVIENVVSSLSGITDISSNSSIGTSRVFVSFDAGTDKTSDANQVSTLVAAAIRSLPPGINPPTIRTFDPNSQPIIQFGISGGAASPSEVSDYVQNTLTPVLQLVPGVANVSVDGAPARQFVVYLNPNKLQYFNLVPQQVVTAIINSAVSTPIGTIVSNNNSLTFTTQNVPANLLQIEHTLVDAARGIAVDDLGTVRDMPVDTNYARVNGTPVVLLSVQRTTDSNTVAVVQGVRDLMTRTLLPTGYSLTYSNDTTGPITASIDATKHELIVTAIVVALIVLLFLGKLNTAISVIAAIPIALSASPILYKFGGFSLNLVSLLALIIAIGIVVDDSIVVSENVERYRAMGFGLKESVLKGASEVFSAVVAATLSLLSVLLPVSFIGGFIGRYLQQFSLGLAAAVAFSLLEAVLFLTVRLAYTPESHTLTYADFFRSWIELPEAIRWGLKNWRTGFGILAAIGVVVVLRLVSGTWLFAPGNRPLSARVGDFLLPRQNRPVPRAGPDDNPARCDRSRAGVGAGPLHGRPRRAPEARRPGSRHCNNFSRRLRSPGGAAPALQFRAHDRLRRPDGECPVPPRNTAARCEPGHAESRAVPGAEARGRDHPVRRGRRGRSSRSARACREKAWSLRTDSAVPGRRY